MGVRREGERNKKQVTYFVHPVKLVVWIAALVWPNVFLFAILSIRISLQMKGVGR